MLYEVVVDISGCQTTAEIEEQVETVLAQKEISPKSMVKIVLTGELAVDDEKDPELLEKQLEDRFYYVKVKDESGWRIDYQAYELDESLKGEFIRTVQRSELSEEDKAEIIRYGIQALADELALDVYGGFVLSFNGGKVTNWRTKEVIFEQPLPADRLDEVCGLSRKYGTAILTYKNNMVVSEQPENK